MGILHIVLLAGSALGQVPDGPPSDYAASVRGSARELSRQLEQLQLSFMTIPGPPEGRGLYGQVDQAQTDCIWFRQQIKAGAARGDLYVAFEKVDGEVNQLLSDIQGFEKWLPAVKMAARRVRAAQHDTHFALYATDDDPAKRSSVVYRQTLALLSRAQNLQDAVRYVFDDMDARTDWNKDVASFRRAIEALQKSQQGKVAPGELKAQVGQTDAAWEKLVNRYRALPGGAHALLRTQFVQVDRAMSGVATSAGVADRRAPLNDDAY